MTVYGYARVSTVDQNLEIQIQALESAGAESIISEVATGKSMERPQFENLKKKLKPGDLLLIYRLDRLGRTLSGVIKTLEELAESGILYRSLTEPSIDSTRSDAFSQAIVGIMAVFGQLERSIICERVKEGVAIAKAQGRMRGRGRPKALGPLDYQSLLNDAQKGERTVTDLCKKYRISRSTYYHVLSQSYHSQS